MRFLSCVALAALLVITSLAPANAQTAATPAPGAPGKQTQQKFATTMCHDRVLCPSSAGNLDFKYADVANKCIREDFSLNSSSGSGFFETYGTDSNNCLLVKPDAVTRSTDRINIVPQCCIVTVSENNCALHCELVTAP
ncbi:MAG: hypothetical protein WAO98_10255 [Alphaproteobacteria bacterium]